MKYSWKAKSDDGSFEDYGCRWFETKEEAYFDMRAAALEKMKWNTDYYDVDEDETLSYSVHFSRNKIVHKSYSGEYTYELIGEKEKVFLHNRDWEVIDEFEPKIGKDFEVVFIDGVGTIWMNNIDGYIVLVEEYRKRILKSEI